MVHNVNCHSLQRQLTQFTAPTATVYSANQQVRTLKCRTLHRRTAQSAMPTSMLQPAKVLGKVDEGTLIHELLLVNHLGI